MNSLEFKAKIEHGVIHLPKEFEEYENELAHVVITLETSEERKTKKNKLFAAFRKLQKAKVFQNIENPLEWQKELRNDWD